MVDKTYIALRGHNESPSSSKRGNFLEILNLVANHDGNQPVIAPIPFIYDNC